MIVGGLATIISLLALAWTREMVWGVTGIFGADPESPRVRNTIIVVAVLFVYILDFSINTGKTNVIVIPLRSPHL
jgi:solute carrier family 45, member 1/2/4